LDDFVAGQLVGMVVMLTFFEKHDEIPEEVLDKLKFKSGEQLQSYFEKPTEDIFLMIDQIVDERCKI
jgi:hypothetical protein